jgi:hypothetical protein
MYKDWDDDSKLTHLGVVQTYYSYAQGGNGFVNVEEMRKRSLTKETCVREKFATNLDRNIDFDAKRKFRNVGQKLGHIFRTVRRREITTKTKATLTVLPCNIYKKRKTILQGNHPRLLTATRAIVYLTMGRGHRVAKVLSWIYNEHFTKPNLSHNIHFIHIIIILLRDT